MKPNIALIQWRTSKKLKQIQAAKLLECNPSTLSRIESGRSIPRTELAVRIAKVTRGKVPVAGWGSL